MGSRDGLTLAQRRQASAPGAAEAAPAPVDAPDRPRPVVQRHCWVQGLPDAPGRWPGLLVEWRQARADPGPGRWQGRVVYALTAGPGACVLVEAWLDAAHLSAG